MLTLLGLLAALAVPQDSLIYSGKDGQLQVAAPRIDGASISVDGDLDEPVWQQAAVLAGFTQYEPVEGIVPEDLTEVRVFYTDDAMYFGVRAWDTHPDLIQARLGERDRTMFGDDWVRVGPLKISID